MNNLRGLLGIIKMDEVQNAGIMELCGVTKGIDERFDESVLRWFGHVKRMENDRIAKRAYAGEYAGSHSVGRPRKRYIDVVKFSLKKIGLGVSFSAFRRSRLSEDWGAAFWKEYRNIEELEIPDRKKFTLLIFKLG